MSIPSDMVFGMGYNRRRPRNLCPYCSFRIPKDLNRCPSCKLPVRRCSICDMIIQDTDPTMQICDRCFRLLSDTQDTEHLSLAISEDKDESTNKSINK